MFLIDISSVMDMAVRGWANDKESRPRSAKRRSSQVAGAPILKVLGPFLGVAETNRLGKSWRKSIKKAEDQYEYFGGDSVLRTAEILK